MFAGSVVAITCAPKSLLIRQIPSAGIGLIVMSVLAVLSVPGTNAVLLL